MYSTRQISKDSFQYIHNGEVSCIPLYGISLKKHHEVFFIYWLREKLRLTLKQSKQKQKVSKLLAQLVNLEDAIKVKQNPFNLRLIAKYMNTKLTHGHY